MTLPAPKHHWNFNEISGTTAADSAGGQVISLDRADWVPGKQGNAIRFNPKDGVKLATTSLPEMPPPWTAGFWVKREADSDGASLFSSSSYALKLEQWENTHQVGFTQFATATIKGGDTPLNYTAPLGQWVHLALVGTATEVTLYVNGTKQGSVEGAINLGLNWLGSTKGYVEFASALLDEIKVFDVALDAEQVKELQDGTSTSGAGQQLWAWGENWGQFGTGDISPSSKPISVPVFSRAGIKAIVAGYQHTMALLEDDTVWAWGDSSNGVFGYQSVNDPHVPREIPFLAGLGVKALSAAGQHCLALLEDGTVWAWGTNYLGQHGTGSRFDVVSPEKVYALDQAKAKVIAIAASLGGSMALLEDGNVLAWGSNRHGELGDGTTVLQRDTPVSVQIPEALGLVKAIAAGNSYSLALLKDGTVWAWGDNSAGQLGNPHLAPTATGPVQVSGLNNVIAITAGSGDSKHCLALLEDGTVWAWGSNSAGQVGNGSTSDREAAPVQVSGLANVKAIAAGADHSVALLEDGTVWAWGSNKAGQLGNGTTSDSETAPVQAVGLSGIKAISANRHYTLAIG